MPQPAPAGGLVHYAVGGALTKLVWLRLGKGSE